VHASQAEQLARFRLSHLNYETDNTVKLAVDTSEGVKEREFIAKRLEKGAEAEARRKAYDAHVKADILLTGRGATMNKTYDPFYHYDPRHAYPSGMYGHPYAYANKIHGERFNASMHAQQE